VGLRRSWPRTLLIDRLERDGRTCDLAGYTGAVEEAPLAQRRPTEVILLAHLCHRSCVLHRESEPELPIDARLTLFVTWLPSLIGLAMWVQTARSRKAR